MKNVQLSNTCETLIVKHRLSLYFRRLICVWVLCHTLYVGGCGCAGACVCASLCECKYAHLGMWLSALNEETFSPG